MISYISVSFELLFIHHLRRNGILVLAGILKVEFALIRAAYEMAGMRLVNQRVDREWQSGAFLFRIGFDCPGKRGS